MSRSLPGGGDRPGGRILYVVSHELSALHLLKGQLSHMRKAGFTVALVVSPGLNLNRVREREGVDVFAIPIAREISIRDDLRSLLELYRLMRRWKPDLVNASTPKAGLLGMMAGWAARVPARLYVLRGLRLETTHGLLRHVLSTTERIAASCAHRVVCISESLRERAVQLGLVPPTKAVVLEVGSSNGVEIARFGPAPPEDVSRLREDLGITDEGPVVGYVGRMTRDKGLVELIDAFEGLKARVPAVRLLLVGEFETGDPVPAEAVRAIEEDSSIFRLGYVQDPAPFYSVMDVFAFPSHREGFGNVCLEAAAAGRPAVGFQVTGVVDAIADGETGALVPPGDAGAFAEALARYLEDSELRARHGRAARERSIEQFQPERVWEALEREYDRMLEVARRRRRLIYRALKRTFDMAFAALALLALAPLLTLLFLIVRVKLGRPALFRQVRPGLAGRPFQMYKFRTMTDARDARGRLLPDEQRLPRVGRFLRATSLDELPELWNVLRGDMSLVGPRPLLMEYLDRYTPRQARRHEVRPGITGWAQINGRNAISWEEKFDLDIWYVENRNLLLDLRIILVTAARVLRREGIAQEGQATTEYFQGTPSVRNDGGV